MIKFLVFSTILAISMVQGISTAWRPIVPAHTSTSILHQEVPSQSLFELDGQSLLQQEDSCPLYKVSMSQQLYFEYIHYKIDFPDMKEFTLCMWTKFHNHSNDHPLFSYAVGDQPRGILVWVANTARSSYFMMNVDGHNIFRLNYPLRLNKWYHSCQSWNGRTGEWQIWVNDERVGRGFNNRLVGHVIKGGGIAITGQEQRQLGGGFLEGHDAPQGSGGLLGEVTMIQLYSVALTAGKAHKDHKHHHAHHYEHDTNNNMPRTTTKAPVTGPPLITNPFLTGGQINHQLKINPGTPVQIIQNGVTLRHPAIIPRDPPPQLFPPANTETLPTSYPVQSTQYFGNLAQLPSADSVTNSAFTLVDGPYHNLFKREKNLSKRRINEEEAAVTSLEKFDSQKNVKKREAEGADKNSRVDDKVTFLPREESDPAKEDKKLEKRESQKTKRGLVHLSDGLILDNGYSIPQGLDNDFFTGLTNFGLELPKQQNTEDEREPAEAEVKMVMDICDGCAEEPFERALIMAWRSVPKKLYSGALYVPATPACKAF